jgi:hypothetical protein
MKILNILVFVCVLIAFAPMGNAQDLSLDEAYMQVHNKQRKPYNPEQTQIEAKDAKYLDHYFYVADLAMRARVMTLRHFYGQARAMDVERYNAEIDEMVKTFDMIDTPSNLRKAESLLIQAIRDQQDFFNEWRAAEGTPKFNQLKNNYRSHPKVASSHRLLIMAYSMLKQQYPRETAANQQSFYDHLCALDFI